MRTAALEILVELHRTGTWTTSGDLCRVIYTTTISKRLDELRDLKLIESRRCDWDGSRCEYRITGLGIDYLAKRRVAA